MSSEELHDIRLLTWVQKSCMISACVYGSRREARFQPVCMGPEKLQDISLCVWVQKSCMISACGYGFRRVV